MALSRELKVDVTHQDKKPLFLFPDIRGQSKIFHNLERILKNHHQIYSWDDPRYNPPSSPDEEMPDIVKLAAIMVKGMKSAMSKYPEGTPYLIAGYSFGTVLACEVINQLKKDNKTVYAYMIDSPPLAALQAHFKPNNLTATQDLISIAHISAQDAGLISFSKKQEEIFTSEEEKKMCILPIEKQLQEIHSKYLTLQRVHPRAKADFVAVSGVVRENHLNLNDYKAEQFQRPDGLAVCFTNETLKKYGCTTEEGQVIKEKADGGWSQLYNTTATDFKDSNKISPVKFFHMDGTHPTLLDLTHAPMVAEQILGYFNSIFHQDKKDNSADTALKIKITTYDKSEASAKRSHLIPMPINTVRLSPDFLNSPSSESSQSLSSSSSPRSIDTSPPNSPLSPNSPSPIHSKSDKYMMDLSPMPISPTHGEVPEFKRSQAINMSLTNVKKKPIKKRHFTPPLHPGFFKSKNQQSPSARLLHKHIKLRNPFFTDGKSMTPEIEQGLDPKMLLNPKASV